jgi:hypothetical protein
VDVPQWQVCIFTQTAGKNDKIVLQDFETPHKILGGARDKSVYSD